jgi:hypothetical protein
MKHPISEDFGGDYPIVQYADDTLLIVPADARVLFNLKGLLRSFSDSTGLHVNFHKSFLVHINMDAQRATHLAMTFGCNIGSMPFTYLGLPLGTHRPTFRDFMPLMNKIEKKVEWNQQDVKLPRETHSCELNFSTMPTFYMCSLTLPP